MKCKAEVEIIDIDSTDDEGHEMKPNISTIQADVDRLEAPIESNHSVSNHKNEIDEMLSNFMDLHSKLANREQLMDPVQRLRWLNILSAVNQTGTNQPADLPNSRDGEEEEDDDEEDDEEEEETQTTQSRGTDRPKLYYKCPRQEPLYVERLWTEPPASRKTYKRKKKSYKRRSPKKAAPRTRKAASTTAPSFQRAKQAATRMHNQIVRAKNHIKKTKPKTTTVKKESRPTVRVKSER